MRHNPKHAETDPEVVRALIAAHPWGTIVSQTGGELVASHYPILLDDEADDLTVLTHVGRPDEEQHGFGDAEMLLIVAGPHGYISPSWYSEEATPAPTWNFSVAHCYGVPQVLEAEENLRVLTRLVAPLRAARRRAARARPGDRPADRARHGRHPPADHALRLQGQDEPGQGPAVAAAGARGAAAAGPLPQRRRSPT